MTITIMAPAAATTMRRPLRQPRRRLSRMAITTAPAITRHRPAPIPPLRPPIMAMPGITTATATIPRMAMAMPTPPPDMAITGPPGTGDAHGGCGHDHGPGGHHHAPTVTSKNEKVVLIGFLLTFGFMFAEVIGGLLSGSLALIADAGHMLTDAAALALAWAGFRFGRRALDAKRTFGYMRFEVLAGFVNAVSLIVLVGWIAYEAVERLITPSPVLAGPMLVVAVLGLVVNGLVFFMLMQGDRDHVNIKGAMVHVLGDLLGSVAAILAAIMIYATGWTSIDPILSLLLSAIVLRSAWALLKHSMHILMEGTPGHVDPEAMRRDLVAADLAALNVWLERRCQELWQEIPHGTLLGTIADVLTGNRQRCCRRRPLLTASSSRASASHRLASSASNAIAIACRRRLRTGRSACGSI